LTTQLLEIYNTLDLPVMERFYTIQGEGAFTGVAAYFVRLGGCDVGCVWCDVKESWDAAAHPRMNVKDLVEDVLLSGANRVVITGGEPAMYDLTYLCAELKKRGLQVNLETSGAYPIRGHFDWICVSPKKFKAPLYESLALADELKVIVFNQSDFDWAEKHAASVRSECLLYLQPEWDKREKVQGMIVDYVKKHPQWRISLQTHKYLNIP
jgi:7-carboxy-7-deazaguanine synthase